MQRTLFTLALVGGFLGLTAFVSAQTPAPARYAKVLFLGNSITKHGPKADIGWTGNWGMAASGENKDYVHLIIQGLTPAGGTPPQFFVNNIADFERAYADYDLAIKLKAAADFKADLIILAIGENVPALKTDAEKSLFQQQVSKLLATLKAPGSNPTVVVRSCFWQNDAKDQALKAACSESGGTFVDISVLGKDEGNYARSERPFKHAGVARHPGDKGMKAIADAILKATPRG